MNSPENFSGEASQKIDSRAAYDALKADLSRQEQLLGEVANQKGATEKIEQAIKNGEALLEQYEDAHPEEFKEEN